MNSWRSTSRCARYLTSNDERASYQAAVEELWAGEPPQVTEQALRMAADGLSRDAILDKLVQDR